MRKVISDEDTLISTNNHNASTTSKYPSVNEIREVFSGLNSLGINPSLVESATLTAIAQSIPHLAPAAEEGKRLLSAQMVIPEVPMSPTELGKAIAQQLGLPKAPSAQQVNQALMVAGLQVVEVTTNKQGKQKTEWRLTELGNSYGQVQTDTARGHGKTVFQLRWFSRVVSVIQEHFMEDQ